MVELGEEQPEAVGRVVMKDAGYIDVKDEATFKIAQAYLRVFAEILGLDEN